MMLAAHREFAAAIAEGRRAGDRRRSRARASVELANAIYLSSLHRRAGRSPARARRVPPGFRGAGRGPIASRSVSMTCRNRERTLVLCKPDCVERGLVGEVVGRLERKGLKIVALELRLLDEATAKRHYAEHDGKPFFGDLVAFITRSPLVAMVVEGPEAWKVVRTLMGATNPREAAPGTIRGDLAIELTENLVHGSDGTGVGGARDRAVLPGTRRS